MAQQRRAGGRRVLVATAVVSVVLAGGVYAVADVRDRVPGPLTDDPVPQPYPEVGTAPAAVDPGP